LRFGSVAYDRPTRFKNGPSENGRFWLALMRCEIDRISLTDEAFDAYVVSFADAVKAERRFCGE